MSIRIYNSLSNSKEPFETIEPGKVGMYLCGPTVYKPSHIGHAVGPVIFDAIKRYLTIFHGYKVNWVVNITDVEDKLIAEANAQGIGVFELAQRVEKNYHDALAALARQSVTAPAARPEESAEVAPEAALKTPLPVTPAAAASAPSFRSSRRVLSMVKSVCRGRSA